MTAITPASGVEGDDLFPYDEDAQKDVLRWVESAYQLAKSGKQGHQDRWDVYYKMYRSYVKKPGRGDWRARYWIPVAFYVIETITPRLVAQLPSFKVEPVSGEDRPGAELMEELLEWASDQSGLYLELVKAMKSSLLYGTGVLKTSYEEKTRYDIRRQPVMQEQFSELTTGEIDVDGNPITQRVSMGQMPTGETQVTRTPYVAYAGPVAEAVDIDNFFVDPVCSSIEDARYVIHKVYRDRAHLEEMFQQGVYKKPPDDVWNNFINDHAMLKRQALVGLGPGPVPENQDVSLYELLEIWTDDLLITTAGADIGGLMLLRMERNPYAHGEKPFVRIVDHLVPHEFWGIGEMEPLEGLQDLLNKLWNSRVDNVALVINTMFAAVMDYVVDPSDLQSRPGGVVRLTEGVPINMAVQRLDTGDVTASSYSEAAEVERMTTKVSGASEYMAGQDAPSMNRTATGVALISEQGNTRFSHKIKIAELTGFKSLARQFAALLQQFMPDEMVVRIKGQEGMMVHQTITPDSIGGRFDFDVESESSTQTESIRREQTLSLFQMLAADPYVKPLKIREDVLKVFGRKDVENYILTPQELQMLYAQQAQQQEATSAQESVPPQ